jgi:NADH-quinone oxidoreductase subunit G
VREHADVVFPAESYAEKEGTVTHPDGRLQRLRPAIAHPEGTRSEWLVLAELSARLGHDLEVYSGPMGTAQVADAIPFYAGITLEEMGGRGVRWPGRDAASALPDADLGPFDLEPPPPAPAPNGALRLGTFRSIWAAPEVEASPAMKFLAARQALEVSPEDARRLGVEPGDEVEVVFNGSSVRATAAVRAAVPAGTVFLQDATAQDAANALTNGEPRLVEVRRA